MPIQSRVLAQEVRRVAAEAVQQRELLVQHSLGSSHKVWHREPGQPAGSRSNAECGHASAEVGHRFHHPSPGKLEAEASAAMGVCEAHCHGVNKKHVDGSVEPVRQLGGQPLPPALRGFLRSREEANEPRQALVIRIQQRAQHVDLRVQQAQDLIELRVDRHQLGLDLGERERVQVTRQEERMQPDALNTRLKVAQPLVWAGLQQAVEEVIERAVAAKQRGQPPHARPRVPAGQLVEVPRGHGIVLVGVPERAASRHVEKNRPEAPEIV
mmetsp:Transcript_6694/g.17380  ORF Transcript_6694/g.17380 Transcript_6694/m.17380 type:complete len:269 (+) Transcript_6694:403-1209(+)